MANRDTSKPALRQMKPAMLHTFHARLAAWYQTHGRHTLPWRTTGDAYAIWVSEVMLQQTQVATVLARFYHPFLAAFPTLEALAAAPQESVLKAWEGLGYYSRARNLHNAAQQMVAATTAARRNRATLPDTADGLLALPGIGRNTAHAVLAFGYHRPVAILEANVKRVVARIFALKTPTDAELWAAAGQLLDHARPFDYNQAMMDLGATVCTPRAPRCGECPANPACTGKTDPESYPTRKQKAPVPTRHTTITVREDAGGRLYLTNRGERLLGGLWGFPQGDAGTPAATIGEVKHTYSHFKLVGTVAYEQRAQATGDGWFTRAQIATLPLSTLDHKVLALIEKHHSTKKNLSKLNKQRGRH